MIFENRFPRLHEIGPMFFRKPWGRDIEAEDFIGAIDRLRDIGVSVWKLLETGNVAILNQIFDELETTRGCDSGIAYKCLCAYFQNIARTGFPDRFLLKNQHLWVKDFSLQEPVLH